MESSLFAFAVDVIDEGPEDVIAAARERAGASGVSLAAAYHHARDILPHNPKRSVYFHDGGTVFFHPEPDRYAEIRPVRGALARTRDPLRELCTAAEKRSMDTRAWTVYLHNSRLGSLHPDSTPQNALGDRFRTELCPAQPEVRRYAVALTADIARYPIRSTPSRQIVASMPSMEPSPTSLRGSSTSRSASPNRLNPTMSNISAIAGKMVSHGASVTKLRAFASMLP